MVISGEREGANNKLTVVMGTTTSSKPPLHNFALPPCLRWGNQKLLRCSKVGPEDFDPEKFSIGRQRKDNEGFHKTPSNDGIEAVRAKLMLDIQTAADEMTVVILGEGLLKETTASVKETAAFDGEKGRPWNLRTRRAACKAPNGTFTGGNGGVKKPNFSPLRTDNEKSTTRLYGESYAAADAGEKREREKFSVSLSRGEIEEDFMVMAGHKPHRRPKKRPKVVQKQLDSLFPGLWLTEVTADMYKVADAP